VELEKENKELKAIKEAFTKLKDAFAKLEAENVQLRVLSSCRPESAVVLGTCSSSVHLIDSPLSC
jgi:cell shape-determining protein MreC